MVLGRPYHSDRVSWGVFGHGEFTGVGGILVVGGLAGFGVANVVIASI